MNICHQCHAENAARSRFCSNCGATLQQAPPQHQAPPGPPPNQATVQTPNYPPPPPPPPPPYNQVHPAYHSQPPYKPEKKKSGVIIAIIIIISLCLLVSVGTVLYLSKNWKKIKVMKTPISLIIENDDDIDPITEGLDLEDTSDVIAEVFEVEDTPTPAPSIDYAQTSTSEADIAATSQAEAAATEMAEGQNLNATATAEAEQALINALIPNEEQWRLEYAEKLTLVPPDRTETYTFDNYLTTTDIAEDLENFILTVTFVNPPKVKVSEHWELGLIFRSSGANNQFRLAVTTPDYWELIYVGPTHWDWKIIKSWKSTIRALDLSEGGSNTFVLVANGDNGAFYINGTFISNLDLRSRQFSGGVSAWFDYRTSQRDGDPVEFKDIHIWSLD